MVLDHQQWLYSLTCDAPLYAGTHTIERNKTKDVCLFGYEYEKVMRLSF